MIFRTKINKFATLAVLFMSVMSMIQGSQEIESEKKVGTEKSGSTDPILFVDRCPKELLQKIASELTLKDAKNLRLIHKVCEPLDTLDRNFKQFSEKLVEENVRTDISLWSYCSEHPILQENKIVNKKDKKQYREYCKKVERYRNN